MCDCSFVVVGFFLENITLGLKQKANRAARM